jgi:hypothetical protein
MSPATDFTPMVVLLSVFIPVGTVGIILGSIAIVSYYRHIAQRTQIGGNLVHEMLQRNMSADEIERVLLAWHADPQLAGKITPQKPPLKKFG